ncbi:helix-turn-helix transcriptional regulator [Actinocorallia longicatena]|uniref:helix-turn-helix domain-containing protein n=1 Tax=Actinocorallia longicatena TaxID=111803 RepID=UPI0031D328E8
MTTKTSRPVGELLRGWRDRRRWSQLDLASRAGVSTRHLSFVETGRSRPSREMLLRLADELEVPLREQNLLLLAAGYAPVYTETPVTSDALATVMDAVRQVLTAHEPFPAVVVDCRWNLVDANAGARLLTDGVDPDLLDNVMRATLHPEGLAPRIVNLGEWRAHLLSTLRHQVVHLGDPFLAELLKELTAYPCDQPELLPPAGQIVVPLRLRYGDGELVFFSTLATFGAPMDITVAELAIESFFPADAATAHAIRGAGGL